MGRAGQTPHGARPNRKEPRPFWRERCCNGALARMGGDVPARCVKPSGRSLEPRSNARPRGMTVLLEKSGRQNSAYRSGCQQALLFLNAWQFCSIIGARDTAEEYLKNVTSGCDAAEFL